MSGGHFDYRQYILDDIAREIDKLAESGDFSFEIVERFEEAARTIRQTFRMVHYIDWFVSGDDEEDVFRWRWHHLLGEKT